MVVCIIPAKVDSRRCPNKNFVRKFDGLNLIEISIRHWSAVKKELDMPCQELPVVFVNASECDLRLPYEYLFDGTHDLPILDVMRHVTDSLGLSDEDIVVWLQPTSPFRSNNKIKDAILAVHHGGHDSAVSCLFRKPEYFTGDGIPRFDVLQLTRWQDYPESSILRIMDGNLFCFRIGPFRQTGSIYGFKTLTYQSSPTECLEIDTPEEMELMQIIWRIMNAQEKPNPFTG